MHECIDLSKCIRVRVAKWLLNLAADPLDAATAAHYILEYTIAPNEHKRQQHLPLWMSVLAADFDEASDTINYSCSDSYQPS
jgi:hypothetical protein